jgi:hypothetical protein
MPNFQPQRFIAGVLVLLLSAAGIYFAEPRLRTLNVQRRFKTTPPPPLLSKFTGGHRRGVSALLWLDLLTWYGGNVRMAKTKKIGLDTNVDHLIQQSKLIIELDPDFPDPYSFAAMVLAWYTDRPTEALPFLREAMIQFPDDWTYPFYYAFIQYHFLNERLIASHFFLKAGTLPKCPSYIPLLGIRLSREVEGTGDAILLLEDLLKVGVPQHIKEDVEKELATLQSIKKVEDAVRQYREHYNAVPTMQDLLNRRLLSEVPKDPNGMPIVIDQFGKVTAQSGGLH